jgi:hypothetical protein
MSIEGTYRCRNGITITKRRKVDSQGQTDFSDNRTEGVFLASLGRRRISGGRKAGNVKGVVDEREKKTEVNAAQF